MRDYSPGAYSDAPIAQRVKRNKRGSRKGDSSRAGSSKNSQNAPLSQSSHNDISKAVAKMAL